MDFKKWKFRVGITLILISVPLFLFLLAIPFLPMGPKFKITLSTVVIVGGEVMFWAGTLMIGKDVYNKFKEKLTSGEWLGKKKED